MAVEIPVFVDVEKAFRDAANRVQAAIKPMQQAIDNSVLEVKVGTGSGKRSTIQNIVDNIGKYSTAQLEKAIQSIDRQLTTLYKKSNGALDFSSGKAGDLVQARVILEAQLDARKNITAEISKATQQTKAEMAAEQQHLAALNMTAGTLAQMGVKAAALRAELQNTDLSNLSKLSSVARQAVQLEQAIAQVNAKIKIMGSESHSLDQLSATLAETNRQYNALSQSDRRGAEGRRLLAEYKTITAELEREGKDLATIVNEEKQAAEAARQRAKMVADAAQKRKTEAAILATTAKNMKTLQEQERILSERLMTATFGSQKYRDLQTQLEAVRKKMKEVEGSVSRTNSAFTMQGRILQGLKSYAAMYLSVFGFARFIKQIRDVTGELEYQRVALGHLLQDVDFGNKLFDDIIEAAKKSPFRITQLVTYTKQLAAYQIEQDKIYDTTMRLADVSAGLGVDMNRLILAYGQVRAASVLRGQELRQFTEAGIPLVEKLAEKFRELGREGTTTADVFKLISQRAVPFEMVKEIFEDMTNAGGMFYNMQEEQAKTLKGRWEKLKDTYDQALMRIGDNSTFQKWNDTVLNILNSVSRNLTGIVRVINAASVAWIAYSIATNKAIVSNVKFIASMIKEYGLMATLKIGVESLAASFRKLWAAMISNWPALAITAIAGVVTYLTTFKNKTKEITEELSDCQKAIEALKRADADYEYGKNLIEGYKELVGITERTETQNNRLATSMEELKKLYPDLADKIDGENESLETNVELLQKAADLKHEEAVEQAKKDLEAQKQVVRGLEEEEKSARAKKEAAERRLAQAEREEAAGRSEYMPVSRSMEDIGTTSPSELKRRTIEAGKAAKQAADEYKQIGINLGSAVKQMKDLEKIVNPQKAQEGRKEWQNLLISMREYTDTEGTKHELFTVPDVESWHELGEALKKLKPAYDEAKASYEGYMTSMAKGGAGVLSLAWQNEAKDAESAFNAFEAIRLLFGPMWGKSGKSGGSDNRLSNLKNEISEATNAYKKYLELLKYMSKTSADAEIADLFPQLKGETPDFDRTLAFLQKKLEDVQKQLKRSPKDKTLLDMQRTLNTEISNLKFDKLKEKIDNELKNLSEEIKRNESARNLFGDLLNLTGDQQLATTLTMQVYGQTGDEFKDRVQKEMIGALDSVKDITGDDLYNELLGDIAIFDMDEIRKQLKKIPETVRPTFQRLLDENDKYNENVAKEYSKLLLKFDEMEQQRVNVENQAAQEIKTINEGLALELAGIEKDVTIKDKEAAKKRAEERAKAVIDGVNSEKELQLSRLERDYRLFFSSVGVISDEAALKVAQNQKRMIADQFARGQKTLAQYKRELKEIDDQLNKYYDNRNMLMTFLGGGFDAVADKIESYGDGLLAIADNLKLVKKENGFTFTDEDKEYIDKVGAMMGGKLFGVSGRKDVSDKLIDSIAKISETPEEFAKNMKKALSQASGSASGFAKSMSRGLSTAGFWVTNVSTLIKELDAFNQDELETPKWLDALASTVTWTLGKAGSGAWDRLASLNEYATSGFEKLSQGNIVGAIADNIKGLVEFWGPNIKKINREIKEQEKLLNSLEESYNDLERAIAKAFGTDYIYNYNEQLKNLQAQQEAYLKQAELERSKGKKADKDAIADYEKSARDAGRTIEDMQTQLHEFFTDSDITSSAEEFANAWIDAYKEFGNTTDAMREKFEDMIQSMVVKSLAAQVMKNILTPVMNAVDEFSKDGELTASEIAAISGMTKESLGTINSAMGTLMSDLGANGINLRNTAGSFTGISRSFAGASEESINTLTAATNTQNFYMSYMPMISENVARILEVMGGDATRKTPVGANIGAVDYYTQMLQYAADIPTMSENLAALLAAVNSIITPKALSTNTHCVAVK